jgi:hypothetical protein
MLLSYSVKILYMMSSSKDGLFSLACWDTHFFSLWLRAKGFADDEQKRRAIAETKLGRVNV